MGIIYAWLVMKLCIYELFNNIIYLIIRINQFWIDDIHMPKKS